MRPIDALASAVMIAAAAAPLEASAQGQPLRQAPVATAKPIADGAGSAGGRPDFGAAKSDAKTDPLKSDPKFEEKLRTMLDRSEKSIKIVREQILRNQSAPFLADLYLQLGDLLSQKSSALYYIQMERDKGAVSDGKESKRFSPVVTAQQEAIGIYQQILKEFPKFDKLDKVMYRLAVSQKSIDEGAAFVQTAERLIRQFPRAHEATQARLLLGQYFFDLPDHDQALKHLLVVAESEHPYERNAARYRIGLIDILQEKHASALKRFEQVATDAALKDEDNPNEVGPQAKSGRSNVKREALIDSVRAYTEANRINPDPVGYYSRIAPTEILFQETIEKLAFRYIFLKQYGNAIKMMRTLAERLADPQKIMTIYREVLLMIPVQDRLDVPAAEMQFVLEKFNYWSTHFKLSAQTAKESSEFFETQARELGTRSHEVAKREFDPRRKAELLERAGRFYELYLGFFPQHANAAKMATNLADVRYNQAQFFKSGDLYLRIFLGEFGATKQKEELIQNAILSLQKPADYEFYEQLRVKGLLVKAIRSYQALDPKKKNDPALNFALAKTLYEQGYYDRALTDLLAYMKRFPAGGDVNNAAELILNYFNIRSDFKGLVDWTGRMLAINPRDAQLRERLKSVRSKALLRRLDEDVKSRKGYDVFAQSKSYLETALTSGDASLRSAAFEQALGRAKAEKDIETFLRAAEGMARSEKDAQKRAELYASVGDETVAVGRYYHALRSWARAASEPGAKPAFRTQMQAKAAKVALLLHDPQRMGELLSSSGTPADVKREIMQSTSAMMESAAQVPPALARPYVSSISTDEDLLAAFKAQPKLADPAIRTRVAQRCGSGAAVPVCKWNAWPRVMESLAAFAKACQTAPAAMTAIEPQATRLAGLLSELQSLQGSGDAALDVLISLGNAQAYQSFGDFLNRAAVGNPPVAVVLRQKAKESTDSAQKSRGECKQIISSAQLISPVAAACAAGRPVSAEQALRWPRLVSASSSGSDPAGAEMQEAQKKIFANRKEWKLQHDLAELYLSKRFFNQAAAAASVGATNFPDQKQEFELLLGCALARMGLGAEAQFHLSKASDEGARKRECMNQATALAR